MSSERPTSEEIEAAQAARVARNLAEFLNPWSAKREKRIRTRIFHQIDSGEALDPQVAVQAWVEIRALAGIDADLRKLAGGHTSSKG